MKIYGVFLEGRTFTFERLKVNKNFSTPGTFALEMKFFDNWINCAIKSPNYTPLNNARDTIDLCWFMSAKNPYTISFFELEVIFGSRNANMIFWWWP